MSALADGVVHATFSESKQDVGQGHSAMQYGGHCKHMGLYQAAIKKKASSKVNITQMQQAKQALRGTLIISHINVCGFRQQKST